MMPNRYLSFLTLCFTMAIVLANWFDARLVSLGTVVTDAGTIIFPLTYLLSDLITEVYGYKQARRAIWYGFLFNLVYLAYGQLIIHLPSPSFAKQNHLFDSLLSINARIIVASILSYLIAEPFNAYILSKLKLKFKGRYISLRFVASTFIAAGIDSVIFVYFAFFKSYSQAELCLLISSMWGIKVGIEILGLPLSLHLCRVLKEKEKLDIFDTETRFTLFSLDTEYQVHHNQFNIDK